MLNSRQHSFTSAFCLPSIPVETINTVVALELDGPPRVDPPVITIKNQSSLTISNIVLSGSGFTNRLDAIPAGSQHRLTVRPSGDSGLRLVFDAGTQHIDSGSQGYFEAGGGYRITATVGTNLSVSVADTLR